MSTPSRSPDRPQPLAAGAVVFDVYGTLLDIGSLHDVCARVTPDTVGFVDLWRRKQLEYTWVCALMGAYEDFGSVTAHALAHVADRYGVGLGAADRDALLRAWVQLRPYPEVAEALARLSDRPLAVLSNGSPSMLAEGLAAAGLLERFALVQSVDDIRTYKPDPAVYALVERGLGLPRDRIVFVSANGWDVAGAAAFGLQVAWVNRVSAAPERIGPSPSIEVRDLRELVDRLAP